MPLVGAVPAVVDVVADELVVDADPGVALEAPPAAALLRVLNATAFIKTHVII